MNVVDEIKARLDIVDVIAESVNLRKTGRSYLGFCPFHSNTRTPAFTVYPDTQSFYCFGCHASGSVFDFVMRKQGIDFRDALQQLAARAGVQLKAPDPEQQQLDQQYTRLLDITSAATYYFNYVLLHLKRGQPGRDYLAQRAIQPDTIEHFQLGYSLNEWTHLLTYLTDKKNFAPEDVAAAGLAIHHEQHGLFDRFRGRLIFPIRSAKGNVVGFGGRALGDVQPKYLNTPQTLLFDKSQVLYGLDLARERIRQADAVVFVEGYIDVLTAHQHGFRNVVAPLGTALNAQHIGLVKRLTRNIYLALDADAAGQRATLRGLHAFSTPTPDDDADQPDDMRPVPTAHGLVRWERDIDLRIIKLPAGRDPDDVIKADPQHWQTLIDQAQPVIDFYIDAYTAGLDLSHPHDQSTALERLVPLLTRLDGTSQRTYTSRLARLLGIEAEFVLDLVQRSVEQPRPIRSQVRARPPRDKPAAPSSAPSTSPAANATPMALRTREQSLQNREEYLLAVLLRHPDLLPTVQAWMTRDIATFPHVQQIMRTTPDAWFTTTINRLVWQHWQAAGCPALKLPDEHVRTPLAWLPAWVQALDEPLRAQFGRLATRLLPDHAAYRYQRDAEDAYRLLRMEQARFWQLRLARQAADAEEQADRTEAQRIEDILNELSRYISVVSAPRRSSSYTDLRDLLGGDAHD